MRISDGSSTCALPISGPLGRAWGDTSIRGHVCRGTGILNNELYAGVLVWNRLRYIKNPATGKRVSRVNPESEWIRTEVPEQLGRASCRERVFSTCRSRCSRYLYKKKLYHSIYY